MTKEDFEKIFPVKKEKDESNSQKPETSSDEDEINVHNRKITEEAQKKLEHQRLADEIIRKDKKRQRAAERKEKFFSYFHNISRSIFNKHTGLTAATLLATGALIYFLNKPSYISSVSALSYYKLISQIPKDVFCFTLKKEKDVGFTSKIKFIQTKYFFGFDYLEYSNFKIPISTPEKAIIDSIGLVPLSLIEESFEEVNIERMLEYLKKIKKSSIIKRIGYLLEKHKYDIHDKIKRYINNKYILLDPIAKKYGKRNKKWRLIINTG